MTGKFNDNNDNKVPGPGEYDLNHAILKDKIVSYKISKSQRDGLVSSEAQSRPGPGSYENHDNFGRDAQSVCRKFSFFINLYSLL